MKIEDALDLTETTHGSFVEHAGNSLKSINNKKIGGLIRLLGKNGIVIDIPNSEKEVQYSIFNAHKITAVPLNTNFKQKVEVISYNLRSENLEVYLRDYCSGSPNGIADGESYNVTVGIKCNLLFNGDSKDRGVIETAKKTVGEFYS